MPMIVYPILTALLVVLWPSDAFAWGPGTHLETAVELLKDISAFSPVVIPLMKKYRDQFIYGMVSADLLVGKKLAGALHHCHNWRIGNQVLKGCRSDKEKASAYGYLTHLASDIVAHNYYVPYMIISSFDAKMKNHTYWELRFDNHVNTSVWDEVNRVISGDHKEFDNLLEKTLRRPLFSFKMNKRIFSTILMVQRLKKVRQTVNLHSKFSQWPLTKSEVRHYKRLIMKTARDYLTELDNSVSIGQDPAGIARLKYANRMRKTLKRYLSRGVVGQKDVDRFLGSVKRHLKKSLFDKNAELPDSYEVL